MNLKTLLTTAALAATIALPSQTQAQVKQDCKACDTHEIQFNVQRGNHPVQEFDIYSVGSDTTHSGVLSVPRGDQQLAKQYFTSNNKRVSPQFALSMQGDNVVTLDANQEIYLVPKQQGDIARGAHITKTEFRGDSIQA